METSLELAAANGNTAIVACLLNVNAKVLAIFIFFVALRVSVV